MRQNKQTNKKIISFLYSFNFKMDKFFLEGDAIAPIASLQLRLWIN